MNGVDDIKEYLEIWQSCRSLALVKSKRSAEPMLCFLITFHSKMFGP